MVKAEKSRANDGGRIRNERKEKEKMQFSRSLFLVKDIKAGEQITKKMLEVFGSGWNAP